METKATSDRLRRLLSDVAAARSMAARARARRWELFASCFPALESMTVLDLGGTSTTWKHLARPPAEVVLVNLNPEPELPLPWLTMVAGDACALPERLRGRRFDLVYSNSLIEHVGGYFRRCQFSDVVHAAADRHWVQTPYRYFPLEPHWLFPLFQFLTPTARAWVAERWSLAHEFRPGRAHAEVVDWVLSVELLSQHEFRHLFSSSTVMFERIAGLPKSMIAVRK